MTIFSGVGSSPSNGPTSGGKVYAFNNISTSPIVVAPANPSRISITFHNPGNVNIIVGPTNVQALNSVASIANVQLTPSNGAPGGCWFIAPAGSITITGECQGAWQALGSSGSGNPLTVNDSNV